MARVEVILLIFAQLKRLSGIYLNFRTIDEYFFHGRCMYRSQTRLKALQHIQRLLSQSHLSHSSEASNGAEAGAGVDSPAGTADSSLIPSVDIQWLIGCFNLHVLHCDSNNNTMLQLYHYQVIHAV